MKSLNEYINEAAGQSVYVLYAVSKKGEKNNLKLCDRITIGVYSSKKIMKYDEEQAQKLLADIPQYKDYEILYYQTNINTPLIDL